MPRNPSNPPAISLAALRREIRALADSERAATMRRFFKTGPGEYGAGDIFIGLMVPQQRELAKRFRPLPLDDALVLLRSPVHEDRSIALMLMVQRFRKGDEEARAEVYRAYLDNLQYVNNWDLVDGSAEHIVGGWLWERGREPLYALVRSARLWDRRVAIIATLHDIRKQRFDDALALSALLLDDPEPLLHKATGWMLREIGKRDRAVLEEFLRRYAPRMPRTALRYAIERFPPDERRRYLEIPPETSRRRGGAISRSRG